MGITKFPPHPNLAGGGPRREHMQHGSRSKRRTALQPLNGNINHGSKDSNKKNKSSTCNKLSSVCENQAPSVKPCHNPRLARTSETPKETVILHAIILPNRPWQHCCSDLTVSIFDFLGPRDILSAGLLTCRSWSTALKDSAPLLRAQKSNERMQIYGNLFDRQVTFDLIYCFNSMFFLWAGLLQSIRLHSAAG
jgi:hypothetical protein